MDHISRDDRDESDVMSEGGLAEEEMGILAILALGAIERHCTFEQFSERAIARFGQVVAPHLIPAWACACEIKSSPDYRQRVQCLMDRVNCDSATGLADELRGITASAWPPWFSPAAVVWQAVVIAVAIWSGHRWNYPAALLVGQVLLWWCAAGVVGCYWDWVLCAGLGCRCPFPHLYPRHLAILALAFWLIYGRGLWLALAIAGAWWVAACVPVEISTAMIKRRWGQ